MPQTVQHGQAAAEPGGSADVVEEGGDHDALGFEDPAGAVEDLVEPQDEEITRRILLDDCGCGRVNSLAMGVLASHVVRILLSVCTSTASKLCWLTLAPTIE